MKIAIVGSSGYIAKRLLQEFAKECKYVECIKVDCTDEADLHLELNNPEDFEYESLKNVDYIIFTAAISSPDRCANEYDMAWKINVTGTNYFIKRATELGCRTLFFSSDAVFGDIPGKIYDEESETHADTPYGKMKKAVEDENKCNPNFKCIRLSYVASSEDRFISYCLKCINENKEAEIFHPFYRNCITIRDVINVVKYFIENWNAYPTYVLDVTGAELVSRVRMADEINRIYDGRLKYKIVNPGGEFYKNRPAITQMTSNYLWNMNIIPNDCFTKKIQMELKGE